MARRSVLFTPADSPEMMKKALNTSADTVVFDLEDAVAPTAKEDARNAVRRVLEETGTVVPELCIRVNPDYSEDIRMIMGYDIDSVALPKVGGSMEVKRFCDTLSDHGVEGGVIVVVESADGVLNVEEIAGVDGVEAVVFGAEDLAADIGAKRTKEGVEVLYARERVVLAASAADIDAIDTLYTDYEDLEGLREDAEFASQLGYDGKLAIHPAQVDVINEAFTPSEDRIEWAEKILKAESETEAGVYEVDGVMVDAPMVKQAESVLERARAAGLVDDIQE